MFFVPKERARASWEKILKERKERKMRKIEEMEMKLENSKKQEN